MQKYSTSLMNEEELASVKKYRTINTATTLAFTGLIPMTLILMLSMKYNPQLYTKLLKQTMMLGAVNSLFMFNASSRLDSEYNLAS